MLFVVTTAYDGRISRVHMRSICSQVTNAGTERETGRRLLKSHNSNFISCRLLSSSGRMTEVKRVALLRAEEDRPVNHFFVIKGSFTSTKGFM